MERIKRRAKELLWTPVSRLLFDPETREIKCRQEFFYNAFQALAFNGIDGDYAEFGCHGGRTFSLAFREAKRQNHTAKFWAFDSFQGLPSPKQSADDHPLWTEGSLATSLEEFRRLCKSNGIPRDAYTVVPGFYEQTLTTRSADDQPRNIALAYLDCDLYSSTKTVLQFLWPRLKHGMIIAFDDYFCWSASQISGERRASLECFPPNGRWHLVPYVQFGWHGSSFVIEDRRILDPGA